MNRREFIRLLALLESEGQLTSDETARLLEAFDEGLITADDLPLPYSEALPRLSVAAALAALAAALAALRRAERLLVASTRSRRGVALRLIGEMGASSGALSRQLSQGRITVREWHRRMQALVRDDLLRQAALGKGAPLSSADLRRLEPALRRQMAYLRRFADEVATRQGLGRPLTTDALAARAELYAGVGYGQFYVFAESGAAPGEVAYYVAVDDQGTCSPCLQAEENSPYLPGAGPFPGVVCLGRGRCRCRRELRLEPATYERLVGSNPSTTNSGRAA